MAANDNELLYFNNFQKGDEIAFEYFFNKHYNHVLGFCIQFIYDKEDATGITQESFLNLWLNRTNIETINGISSFLYTHAKSKCLNVIRHKKVKDRYENAVLNEKERELDFQLLKSLDFDTLALSELRDLINKSIDELPKTTRKVFLKKRFEDKKNKEIAQELNMSLKSVEAHMTKALKLLKEKLADYLPAILLSFLLH